MKGKVACCGHTPVRKGPLPTTYPGGVMIGEEEKRAVIEVMESQALFRYYGPWGPSLNKVDAFEEEFAKYIGTDYALGVTSGTGALLTALVGAKVGPGDEVIVPAYTWIADPAAVVVSRAIPVIAEVDKSLTLNPEDFEAKITERTKAVIVVHMRGVGSKMNEIMEVARANGITVIEDVSQSCGASYKGKKLGSIGDIGVFSFQMKKVITAGEGGALTTNDKSIYGRCVTYHDPIAQLRKILPMFGVPSFVGINFRMSELAGAVALEQLRKLDKILNLQQRNKMQIKKGMADIEGIELREIPDPEGDAAICIIFFLPTPEQARAFVKGLRAENIDGLGYGTHNVYTPEVDDWHVYSYWKDILQKNTVTAEGCPFTCPYYKGKIEYTTDLCPKTLAILGRAVHMDVSPLLTEEDIDQIIEGVHKVAKEVL